MNADAKQAKAIFLEAVEEHPPDQWPAFLDRACAGQPDLRGRVEVLLQAHREAGTLPSQANAEGSAPSDASGSVEYLGSVIGCYQLLQQIGEGGMGTVFLAEQTHPVQRQVALKVIKAGMDSRQVSARFEVERQALALMDHPNIAKVHDAGTTSDGRLFFVMELVQGVPITRYCDEHHLTPRQRLELFVPVCQAIQHAHQKGIIHRDLKPSNVLVARYDDHPVPKVIDFGVAKATGQQLTEQSLHTGFGAVVGTVEYMSPEQAGFNQLDVDTRSDIYSLGVLLYELLAGSPPFSRKELEKAGVLEMLRVIREQEPSKPSNKLSTADGLPTLAANRGTEPKRLTALLRGELDWIVMKALDKDRTRRYETANGFAADVQRYLNDEPVQACPPSAAYRLRKFVRRNKGKLAVAAGMFLAVTVMAASIGWAVRDRAARMAEIERKESARQAKVEGRVRDSLNSARALIAENKWASARHKLAEAGAQLGNDGPTFGNLAAAVEAGEAALDRLQRFLDLIDRAHQAETAPVLEPALAADDSQGNVGTLPPTKTGERQPAEAVPFLLQALQLYQVLDRDDWNTNLRDGLLAMDQVEQTRRTVYEELLWLADDIVRRRQEHRSERPLSPEAAARQALVYLGKAESAHRPTHALYVLRARCRKALGEEASSQADRQLADKTPPTMALDHYLRGQAAYDARQLAEGTQAFEAALHLEPTHYWSMMRLGYCLCDLGQGPADWAGAARVFTGCILKRPDHAHAYHCRAIAYAHLGRYEEAVSDYSKAIELDPKLANAWGSRGIAYRKLGQPDKAVADYSKAIELNPKDAKTWYNRGIAYRALGQPDKAVADFSKAIELNPKFADAGINRGNVYSDSNQPDKAVADYSKTIELDPKHAKAWYNRGNVYRQLGQPDKAVADYSKAIELDPKYANAWNNRGNVYRQLGQPDKAVADYSKAIELAPTLANAWNNRGNVYRALGQPDKAVADYSKAIELDPKYAMAWHNRGNVYSDLNQPDKAVADYSKAVELAPNHPQRVGVYLHRAQANSQLGRFPLALMDYQTFLKRAPANAQAHNELARLLATCPDARLRNPAQAVELANKAVHLAPKEGRFWNTLGVAEYRAGKWQAAIDALHESMELRQGGDADDWLFLAMAHQKLGNKDEGRKWYDRAILWLEKNQEALEKDKPHAVELRRFQIEAEEVLQLKKK